ncbi:MAG TPA: hypothetical protein VHY75_07505 [Steroidobacteraceae bacterium]|jgi:hypothetical protein|nr:hypothetical protein [Steroidobacteraceae bacterium]
MTLNALIAVFGLTGLLLLITAIRRFRLHHVSSGLFHGISAAVLFLTAAFLFLLGINLRTYQQLTNEAPAGDIQFAKVGAHQYNGVLTYPNGEVAYFPLSGDEWQVDARILKWTPIANLMGFDTAFRLERISGRYTSIEDERSQPRTVYELHPPSEIDLWKLVHDYHRWLPWFDALYGSATYVPMADGALYEIKASPSGLLARPLNQAARNAVGNWH